MTTIDAPRLRSEPRKGITFILLAMLAASINDMLIKHLSDRYPLHEIIFIRSAIALCLSFVILKVEGGWRLLRTDRPHLHLLRCLLIVGANMCYFMALAVLPLAEASALFYVMPLLMILLSVPLLGERVGPWRIGAVLVGFCGVLLMLNPASSAGGPDVSRLTLLLPMAAALLYACMQILTRRLGVSSKASAMAIYIQCTFIGVSLVVFAIGGDGRFARLGDNSSLEFLLRAWRWPERGDLPLLAGLGTISAVVAYALSQAYRSAEAATVAPFEYSALPLAIFWGWAVWGHLPSPWVSAGIVLIVGAGLAVLLRERRTATPDGPPPRRW